VHKKKMISMNFVPEVSKNVNEFFYYYKFTGQLSLLPSAGQEMSTSQCCDALQLGSKGRYGSFHLWINVWVAGKTV